MEVYNGQRDSTKYLELYHTFMKVQEASQVILYQDFSLTLI